MKSPCKQQHNPVVLYRLQTGIIKSRKFPFPLKGGCGISAQIFSYFSASVSLTDMTCSVCVCVCIQVLFLTVCFPAT
ncbi:hypothetical protein XELAEV_18038503mg [Xenopus laevis]|uniref:Uncharacterized protein n=1 Tax=Xenopus laevis TaxID=8355 RepID=A0A974H7D8_XENLA|nr:hypothetical protein XELAEV_18038503mg [Xenopus laevis]